MVNDEFTTECENCRSFWRRFDLYSETPLASHCSQHGYMPWPFKTFCVHFSPENADSGADRELLDELIARGELNAQYIYIWMRDQDGAFMHMPFVRIAEFVQWRPGRAYAWWLELKKQLEDAMTKRQNISSDTIWEDRIGYSRAVRVGNIVEVAGTTAADADGNPVAPGDPYAQTKYIIEKIERALIKARATLNDVVRTRMFIVNTDDWQEVGRAHGEFFRDIKPVATMVTVAGLIDSALLVEIEVTAIIAEEA